jgi:hypothetical protein
LDGFGREGGGGARDDFTNRAEVDEALAAGDSVADDVELFRGI